ncbi:hypothetical protein [Pedobacter sp. R-06]
MDNMIVVELFWDLQEDIRKISPADFADHRRKHQSASGRHPDL